MQDPEWIPLYLNKKPFGKKTVICMCCQRELSTLAYHVRVMHGLTPEEYRSKWGIPKDQPLTSKNFSAKRRRIAILKGLDANLKRTSKKEKIEIW